MEFVWVPEHMVKSGSEFCIEGIDLWARAREQQCYCNVSSVLIGLEGSSWGKTSPFGLKHGNTGKNHPISAIGNHKWSEYRNNHMYQIPADLGGMHMTVTKWMFEELQKTCDIIGLFDPLTNLDDKTRSYTRTALTQRFCEKEFFKLVLAGNSKQARHTVEWMKEYAATHK